MSGEPMALFKRPCRDSANPYFNSGGNAKRFSVNFSEASRIDVRPGGTVVRVRDVEIGGNHVVMMAGPCSVENRDQIEQSAETVARHGAKVIRGGAFKPRSSPYSFQGMGEEGLRIMRDAADRHN